MNIPKSNLPRVIIIGGGFAGIALAKKLKNKPIQVVLLDKHNYHTFQPLLYQVATGGLEAGSIAYPIRKVIHEHKDFYFRLCHVNEIDTKNNKIIADIGELSFDYLVIATGSKTNYFGNKEIERNSIAMKTIPQSLNIRSLILENFEQALLTNDVAERNALINFVLVGGGPTGVELAGALAEMKKAILPKDYPDLDVRKMEINLIQGSDRVLDSMSENASAKAEKFLVDLGVEVWKNIRVTDYDGNKVYMKSGKEIPSNNVIWAAGVTGNVIDGFPSENLVRNRYIVDRFNKVKGYDNIYAVGDIAYMETPKYPQGHPQVANVAINQAKNLGKNFLRKNKNEWVEYEYKDQGSLATIGKHRAVVDLPFIKFQGFLAWYFWMFLHLMLILSVRNKLAIFFNWMWSYFNKDSSLRLIISPSQKNNTQQ